VETIVTNLSDLREKVEELTEYLELSHPADVEALSDELGRYALLFNGKKRITKESAIRPQKKGECGYQRAHLRYIF
jgi:hypothetical protein